LVFVAGVMLRHRNTSPQVEDAYSFYFACHHLLAEKQNVGPAP
jgi:hypothetical protein